MTLLRQVACAALLCVVTPLSALAFNLSISVADVNTFVQNSKTNGDRISELIGNEVQARLATEGVTLSESGLLFRRSYEDDTQGGCSLRYSTSEVTATALLTPQSEFKFVL